MIRTAILFVFFAEKLVWLGLKSVSDIISIPTHEKKIFVGKSGPNATFKPNFLWVGLALGFGEFLGLIVLCMCFQTQQKLVNRKTSYCKYEHAAHVPLTPCQAKLRTYL